MSQRDDFYLPTAEQMAELAQRRVRMAGPVHISG